MSTPRARRVGIVGHIGAMTGDEGVAVDHFMATTAYVKAVYRAGGTPLVVVSCQVGDSAGGWAADGGVVSVMVVAVEEAVKSASATGF